MIENRGVSVISGMADVLIIDDDEPLRQMLGCVVESFGHSVRFATDGLDGVKHYRAAPADAVMMDLMMPHSGLAAIRVLKEQFPDVRIIAMTGASDHRLGLAKHLGATCGLAKPFRAEEVGAALAAVLGR